MLGVEIVDESDRTVDMRQLAMKLRDQRLAKLQRQLDGQAPREKPQRAAPQPAAPQQTAKEEGE